MRRLAIRKVGRRTNRGTIIGEMECELVKQFLEFGKLVDTADVRNNKLRAENEAHWSFGGRIFHTHCALLKLNLFITI